MSLIERSIDKPIREDLSFNEMWRQNDCGLIKCWEVGRKLREENSEIAFLVSKDELPVLVWKGGIDKPTKKGKRYGTLHYLAMWKGLKNETLSLDTNEEYILICSRTNEVVTFSFDSQKYNKG